VNIIKSIIKIFLLLLSSGAALLLIPRLITALFAWPRTYSSQNAPNAPVAIVFGAGLSRDGSPSAVLRDRVETAAELYFSGKVQKILMSGDNRTIYYNEPGAMHEYANQLGIPDEDIVLDYAGRSTYETCYRARAIFGADHALLVTQSFHLPRAIYTCNMLGLPAEGVMASVRAYRQRSYAYWHLRELGATLAAMWDVHIERPLPVLGEPEPIFPKEAQ
jgi:vancomycin permeability regulator SanA